MTFPPPGIAVRLAFSLERAVLGVGAQPVAEHAETDAFWAVRAEHMQVGARVGESEAPMLVEGRFSNGEDRSQAFERGDIHVFVAGRRR